MLSHLPYKPITNQTRALLGFGLGFCIMLAVVKIFPVNSFDFENMQRGIRLILSGVNPWAATTHIDHFYNPPFSVLFLWPMLFSTPKIYLVIGGAFLFAFVFYHKVWVALAWFATNSFLWLVAAGGIDMYVIGCGLILLTAGDKHFEKWLGVFLRVLAYGLLMVKPQGGIFIVVLFILTRRDWKGLLFSVILFGLPFLYLYPDWFSVLTTNPPVAQTYASHTLMARFGLGITGLIATLILFSRRWTYWQLGGAMAGILMPYGMPGLPIFLSLTAATKFKAALVVIVFSGLLSILTWITPPPDVDFYGFLNPLMSIYHLSILGLVLALACLSDSSDASDTIGIWEWVKGRTTHNKVN